MKKFVILLICVCLLLCSCNAVNDDKDQTDKSTQATDGSETDNSDSSTSDDPDTHIFSCFDFDKYMKNPGEISENVKIQAFSVAPLFLYYHLPKINFDEEWRELLSDQLGDHSDILYYAYAGTEYSIYNEYKNHGGEWSVKKVDNEFYPDISVVYDYIIEPSKIFGNDIRVDDIIVYKAYDSGLSGYNSKLLMTKDIFVYYETSEGNYLLFVPMEYSTVDPDIPRYIEGNAKEIGYSDTFYLLPIERVFEAYEKIVENNNAEVSDFPYMHNYDGETQLHKLIDLEPYKLVPGQLPE